LRFSSKSKGPVDFCQLNPKKEFVAWASCKRATSVKECTYSTCFISFNSNGQGNKEFIT